MANTTDQILEEIANRVLDLDTLKEQKSGLDFREQAVWGIKQALQEAFMAGIVRGQENA